MTRRLYPAARADVRDDGDASEPPRSRGLVTAVALALLWCIWHAVRLTLLGLLTIPAPVIRILLSGFALVMLLMAFFLEFTSTRPIPFIGMLALALGAFATLAIYEGLLQLLSGRRD